MDATATALGCSQPRRAIPSFVFASSPSPSGSAALGSSSLRLKARNKGLHWCPRKLQLGVGNGESQFARVNSRAIIGPGLLLLLLARQNASGGRRPVFSGHTPYISPRDTPQVSAGHRGSVYAPPRSVLASPYPLGSGVYGMEKLGLPWRSPAHLSSKLASRRALPCCYVPVSLCMFAGRGRVMPLAPPAQIRAEY